MTAQSCDHDVMGFLLSLYDAAGNLLVEEQAFFSHVSIPEYTIPVAGTYYIRMTSPDDIQESTGGYTLFTALNSPDELSGSGTEENPVPIAFGETLDGLYDWPSDGEYYEFEGVAGQVVDVEMAFDSQEYMDFTVKQPGKLGWQIGARREPGFAKATFVLPATGRYTIQGGAPDLCWRPNATPVSYQVSLERESLYLAGMKNGQVNGVSFGTNDIMTNDAAGQWQKVFDGEDVGVTVPLNGFEMMDDGSILISLKSAQSLAGVGQVLPQDMVRFVPTALGETTAGQFTLYMRGNQVGLTTAREAIDAITLLADGSVVVSTKGIAAVPKQGGGTLNAADEDLLRFHPTGPHPSAGSWSMYFDASEDPDHSKLGAQNMIGAGIVLERNEVGDGLSNLLFTLAKNYRMFDEASYPPASYINVLSGDLIGFHDTLNHLVPQPERATFGFPQAIVSLSLGAGWGEDSPPGGGDETTFTPSHDTFVNSAAPTTQYGGNPSIKVKDAATDMNSYLKFNVTGLSGSVESAILRLQVTDAGADGGGVYSVSNNFTSGGAWTEVGLTWNNAPTIGGAPLDSAGAVSNGQWVELDVTAVVGGNGVYSFAVRNANLDIVFYSSKEGLNPPELVITTQ